jgi:hypothetical protein
MALRALLGHVTDHELAAFEAEEFSVETATRSVNVSTDGEVTVMARRFTIAFDLEPLASWRRRGTSSRLEARPLFCRTTSDRRRRHG